MNNKSLLISISIIFISILFYAQPNVYVIGWINIVSLCVLSAGIGKISGRLFTPFIFIAVCLYLFHSGNLWLALFSDSPKDVLTSFYERYSTSNYGYILSVYKDVTILLILFMMSGVLFAKRSIIVLNNIETSYTPTRVFENTFHVLYIIGFAIEIKRAINVFSSSYAQGYLYESSIETYISTTVNVLLLFFLFQYRNDRKQFKHYIILQLVRILFISFFVGNRGASIINLLVTLFITVNYSYLSSNTRKIRRMMGLVVLSMVIILPFISAVRGRVENYSLETFQSVSYLEKFLSEFGGTIENVFLSIDFTNMTGVPYGFQLLCNFLAFFPGSTMIFGDVITNNTSIPTIMNSFFDRAALGGSLIGQLYFNFGDTLYLYVSIFIIGAFSAFCSNKLMEKKESIYYYVFYLCLFSGLLTWVRGELYDLIIEIKLCIYILLLIYFSKNMLMKKNAINYKIRRLSI